MARKTIDLEAIKALTNTRISDSVQAEADGVDLPYATATHRLTLYTFVETVLMDTEAYRGFRQVRAGSTDASERVFL